MAWAGETATYLALTYAQLGQNHEAEYWQEKARELIQQRGFFRRKGIWHLDVAMMAEQFPQVSRGFEQDVTESPARDKQNVVRLSLADTGDAVGHTVDEASDLIPDGAAWQCLSDGTDPGAEWKSPTFDDSSWDKVSLPITPATSVDDASRALGAPTTIYLRRYFNVDALSSVPMLNCTWAAAMALRFT
jgi:hypothetical protein